MSRPHHHTLQATLPGDPRFTAAILIGVCVPILLHTYQVNVLIPGEVQAATLHAEVLNQQAGSPYRYRILAPTLIAALQRGNDFLGAHTAFFVLASAFSLTAIWAAARALTRSAHAAHLAVLLSALALIPTLEAHFYQPWSWLEVGFVAVALLLASRGASRAFFVLTLFASLNRETAVFLPLIYLLVRWPAGADGHLRRAALGTAAGSALTWAAVFFGLRAAFGQAPHVEDVAELWTFNTGPGLRSALQGAGTMIGGLLGLALVTGRRAPRGLRRAAWIAGPYLASVALWGVWHEVRLLAPLLPILAPWAALALTGDAQGERALHDTEPQAESAHAAGPPPAHPPIIHGER